MKLSKNVGRLFVTHMEIGIYLIILAILDTLCLFFFGRHFHGHFSNTWATPVHSSFSQNCSLDSCVASVFGGENCVQGGICQAWIGCYVMYVEKCYNLLICILCMLIAACLPSTSLLLANFVHTWAWKDKQLHWALGWCFPL